MLNLQDALFVHFGGVEVVDISEKFPNLNHLVVTEYSLFIIVFLKLKYLVFL